MRQRHSHEQLAGADQRHESGEVGLGAGVRLHVGVLRPEQLLEPVDGQLLDLVDHLTPAVVPLPGVSLRVLVGQRRAHGIDHRPAGEVLAGNQLQSMLLAAELGVDEPGDQWDRLAEVTRYGRGSFALLIDLLYAAAMAAAGKFRIQPGLQDLDALVFADEASRQDEDVGIVVLAREPGDLGRPGHGRPHSGMTVGGIGHSEPGAAEQHSTPASLVLHLGGDAMSVVRIISGFGAMGAEIERLVSQRPKLFNQPLLQLEAGVVRSDGNDFGHVSLR